ncbi:MAG: VWA domain-containing protein [Pyrinomonadaceae bacterium]|nr:VWA domain-containing protein [Pyrinomonadaceae bacterium]
MRNLLAACLFVALLLGLVPAQTPQRPKKDESAPDDVVRITTRLVQTDVVVTDKNDKIVSDLGLADFELYDNGKKQDLNFIEFVSATTGRRVEGNKPSSAPLTPAGVPLTSEIDGQPGISAKDVKRVVAFVVDDLTIPVQDINPVRNLLLDFVNNKMRDGDLVAIVRVIGGKGLLQQLTSDRQLLRRAIAAIQPISHPYAVSNRPDEAFPSGPGAFTASSANTEIQIATDDLAGVSDNPEISSPSDDINQFFRGLSTLTSAMFVTDSLKEIPGHKNVVIISGGIPIFEARSSGVPFTNVTYLLNQLSDRAVRSGVVINTLDPRGLNASPGVLGFNRTETRANYESELMGRPTGFGRGGAADQATFGPLLAGGAERLGLATVAKATGGVSVVNTNDFSAGMDKIMARSEGYYLLAYTPGGEFDRKFHKLEVKVKRAGLKTYHHSGYAAREDKPRELRTKEEQIVAAASSPLSRRDIDVTPNVTIKLMPPNNSEVDLHLLIDANKLTFNEVGGKHQASLDIVGFIFDQLGKQRGGFSETVVLNLSNENYQRAKTEGLTYSATTQLPPGYYQVRSVVREASSGSIGTFSKYVEIPDLTKERLAMSSLFLYSIDPPNTATPLLAVRQIKRTQDLRYAATVYNVKLKGGKPSVTAELIISQAGKVLTRESEQILAAPPNGSPMIKIGQFGLSKVPKGRYVLTLVITDTLADKKDQKLSRSIDFNVID